MQVCTQIFPWTLLSCNFSAYTNLYVGCNSVACKYLHATRCTVGFKQIQIQNSVICNISCRYGKFWSTKNLQFKYEIRKQTNIHFKTIRFREISRKLFLLWLSSIFHELMCRSRTTHSRRRTPSHYERYPLCWGTFAYPNYKHQDHQVNK